MGLNDNVVKWTTNTTRKIRPHSRHTENTSSEYKISLPMHNPTTGNDSIHEQYGVIEFYKQMWLTLENCRKQNICKAQTRIQTQTS
jgi:hypothetical protein